MSEYTIMRKNLLYFLVLVCQIGFSQSQTIEIRENQTSHLIFPSGAVAI